jgi:hypothetical protein
VLIGSALPDALAEFLDIASSTSMSAARLRERRVQVRHALHDQ